MGHGDAYGWVRPNWNRQRPSIEVAVIIIIHREPHFTITAS